MRLRHPSKEWLRLQAKRLWGGTKRTVGALPGLLTSYRFVCNLLLAAIVVELVYLGIGVVRRLEVAAHDAEQAAMLEMAAFEAQAFAREQQNTPGGAGIGTLPAAPAATLSAEDADDGAPPLRPRDVDTILASDSDADTDAWIASWGLDDDPAANGGASATGEGDPSGLDDEQTEEVEHYIRQGVAALISGDMRKCLLYLEQARALSPNHPAMLYHMGMAYDKLLNPSKARMYYTQVFNLREGAGRYFELASRRLSYGVDLPSDMRGKLAFGPYRVKHTVTETDGENVEILLPVLLAPGEDLKPEGIYIKIRFFDLVNNRRIEFAHAEPSLSWQNNQPEWKDGEENLVISYTAPTLTEEEKEVYGDLVYYGFIAKLYYYGEPLDCISTPSSLILHEQRLNLRRDGGRKRAPSPGLLPDEDLEEAIPYSDYTDEPDAPGS